MALLTSSHPTPVYLVDFSVYKPPEEFKVDRAACERKGQNWSVSTTGTTATANLGLACGRHGMHMSLLVMKVNMLL
jgi:hypothetical protein